MGKATGIAWTTSSWSPWIGCTEVSPGCDHCYARVLDNRHKYGGEGKTHWGAGVPRYRTKQWDLPLKWNKQAAASGQRWTVFPSLCDPFDNEVPGHWRNDLFNLIERTPNLTWLLLTKRISNAVRFLPWGEIHMPPNVWIGASVVNQAEADRDIPKLLATPAAKRFVSYEPALGPVDWDLAWMRRMWAKPYSTEVLPALDWVIIGGESNQGKHMARPFNHEWARTTIAQCRAAGVAVFMKQTGSDHTALYERTQLNRAGADPAEWPEDLRVQEFPA